MQNKSGHPLHVFFLTVVSYVVTSHNHGKCLILSIFQGGGINQNSYISDCL